MRNDGSRPSVGTFPLRARSHLLTCMLSEQLFGLAGCRRCSCPHRLWYLFFNLILRCEVWKRSCVVSTLSTADIYSTLYKRQTGIWLDRRDRCSGCVVPSRTRKETGVFPETDTKVQSPENQPGGKVGTWAAIFLFPATEQNLTPEISA